MIFSLTWWFTSPLKHGSEIEWMSSLCWKSINKRLTSFYGGIFNGWCHEGSPSWKDYNCPLDVPKNHLSRLGKVVIERLWEKKGDWGPIWLLFPRTVLCSWKQKTLKTCLGNEVIFVFCISCILKRSPFKEKKRCFCSFFSLFREQLYSYVFFSLFFFFWCFSTCDFSFSTLSAFLASRNESL